MTQLPEPNIIVDMDWYENQVYDCGDLVKYGRAEYLRGLEDSAKTCESLFDMNDDSCNEAETCAAAIRALGNKA